MSLPFIYIAATMRSGSTVIQESLTSLPQSFIIHEPLLWQNKFDIKDVFLQPIYENYNIDIKKLLGSKPSAKLFANKVLPVLNESIQQLGIKETENSGWKKYYNAFPDIRIILTARDPRDLFLAMYKWVHDKEGRLIKPLKGKPYSFDRACEVLQLDLNNQLEMFATGKALKVKYEDFCTNNELVSAKIRKFVKSPLTNSGVIGGFLSVFSKRYDEYLIHKNKITTSRIGLWRTHPDKKLVEQALLFYDNMEDYRNFWGY